MGAEARCCRSGDGVVLSGRPAGGTPLQTSESRAPAVLRVRPLVSGQFQQNGEENTIPANGVEACFSDMCVVWKLFLEKNILLIDFSPCVLCTFMIRERETPLKC